MAVIIPAPRIGKTTVAMPARPVRKPTKSRKLVMQPVLQPVARGLINR
jgi:hypothetical protein